MPTHNLLTERLIGLAEAARLFPAYRQGRPVSPVTPWRWATKGVRRSDGATVRLEAVRVGGRWLTTVEAVERFIQNQTPILATITPPPRQVKPAPAPDPQRGKVRGELAELGI